MQGGAEHSWWMPRPAAGLWQLGVGPSAPEMSRAGLIPLSPVCFLCPQAHKQLAKQCPGVPIVYDTVDLHFLREARDVISSLAPKATLQVPCLVGCGGGRGGRGGGGEQDSRGLLACR